VAIIDGLLAERFGPARIRLAAVYTSPQDPKDVSKITKDTVFFTVVGIAKEVVTADPKTDVLSVGTFYFPFEQTRPGGMTFTVRLAGPSATIANDIKQAITGIDPELPVFRIQPMQEWIDRALVGRRAPMLISAGFSAVALFLAGIGIYGVLAYGVTERKRELGCAHGARRYHELGVQARADRRLVDRGIRPRGWSAGIVFRRQLMQSLLYGVAPMNVAVIALVTMILAVVALVATGIPAMRASRINPVVVLQK
jgi:putative ABC transport system permease protein